MELFKIDPGLAMWTWIIFGIMFIILSKFAFPGLLENIRKREDAIAHAVNNASQIEKRLEAIEKERAGIIKESKAQASEILRQTRAHAEAIRKELIAKSEDDARDVIEQAKVKIDEERAAVIDSLRSDIADFVCDTSEKIIGRSFVPKNDRNWVKELVETL